MSAVWCLVAHSCPTLCDPMDCNPPGFSVHGISEARILEWVAFPSPEDLLNPGIEPGSPALHTESLPSEPPGKFYVCIYIFFFRLFSIIGYYKILNIVPCAIQ